MLGLADYQPAVVRDVQIERTVLRGRLRQIAEALQCPFGHTD
jgi:hypothetical protein